MSENVKMLYISWVVKLLCKTGFATYPHTFPPFFGGQTLILARFKAQTVDNLVNKVENIKGCFGLHNSIFF